MNIFRYQKVYVPPTREEVIYLFLVLDYFDQNGEDTGAIMSGKNAACDVLQISRHTLDMWVRGKMNMPWTCLFMLVARFDSGMIEDMHPATWRETLEVPDKDSPCYGFKNEGTK